MKKTIFVVGLLAIFATMVAIPLVSHAKSYVYSNYDVDIQVNEDATFTVKEKQTFDFDGDFTFAYRGIELNKLDYLEDIKVTDEDGRELSTELYKEDGKQMVKWYYNASNEKRTFTVEYKVFGGLGYYDWDELYWNIVPEERDVIIKNATATVHLPNPVNEDEMKAEVFVQGKDSKGATAEIVDDQTFKYTAKNLEPYDNFTIVAGWPQGAINRTYTWVYYAKKIGTIIGIALPILVFFLLLMRWLRKGRDPKGKDADYSRYEPPKNFTPLLTAAVINEKIVPKDISANIIDLAVRGYLRIEEHEKKGFIGKSKDHVFVKLKEPNGLPEHERVLFDGLFSGKNAVAMSELKNQFYTEIPLIQKSVMQEITDRKFFVKDPTKVIKFFAGFGSLFIIAGVLFTIFGSPLISSGWIGVGLILSGVLFAVFAKAMPQKTPAGVEAKDHIEGFKEYLHVAERFRVQDNKPEKFEKFLAYAMILGVEKQWAKRFTNIYDEQHQPSWYVAPYFYGTVAWSSPGATQAFTTNLTSNLSSLSTNLSSVMSSQPSGGSGGSGFGGGGFGGGGGGGGSGGAG